MIDLKLGDSLEIMPTLQEKSFDLLILDWPYNIKKAEWDRIPNYLEWCGTVLKEHERLLKDNGSLYIFHNDFLVISEIALWIKSNTDFVFKQMIIWDKMNKSFSNKGFVHQRLSIGGMRNYYDGFTEYILFYTFQDETGLTAVKLDMNNFTSLRQYFKDFQSALDLTLPEINRTLGHRRAEHGFYWGSSQWDLPTEETYLELCKLPLKNQNGFLRREYEDLRREYEDLRREYEDLRREYEDLRYTFNQYNNDTSIWNYRIENNENRVKHETQKPLPLIENIIKHSSNENDLVGDFFMGTGTTAEACQKLNRDFIGIEKDRKYFEIAKNRINKQQLQFI